MSGSIVDIAPAYIAPSPDNPRRDLGELDELVRSIKAVGIQEPIIVRPDGKAKGHDRYELIAGARRLAAAERAGLMWVPCIVREYSPEQRLEIMLIENLQRRDLAPLEEATAFNRLIEEFAWSQEKVAERIGRSQSHVSKRLSLLNLTPKARKALDSGGITPTDAVTLARLADDPKRMDEALLTHRNPYHPMERVVERLVVERDRDRKLAAAIEAAEADPAPYLPAVKAQYGEWTVPKGSRALSSTGEEYSPLGIAPAKHRKEPCHAVTVVPRPAYAGGAKLMYICTDPRRHPEGKESPASTRERSLSKAEREERDQEKALAAAAKVRRAFVAELPGKIERDVAEELILHELIRASHQSVLKIACGLLGIEPVRVETKWHSHVDYAGPLREAGGASKAARQRVALGVYFAAIEEQAGATWGGWGNLGVYFDVLRSHGYELSEAEQTKLAADQADELSEAEDVVPA